MKPSFKKVIRHAFLAGITAAVINSILFFLFSAIGIISDSIYIQDNQPLTLLPVVISSIVPSILAGMVFYLLGRYTRNGYKIFFIIAILLLIVSFANPFMAIKDITISMGVALNVMHIVVVLCLLYFFKKAVAVEVLYKNQVS
jgi:hypothetical protein